jgi:hypothetical protein
MSEMVSKSMNKLLDAAAAVATHSAQETGDIGFTARALVICTLPHSKPDGNEFKRKNGDTTLTMYSPNGLPYGSVPRLLLAWITTEVVRTKSRTLNLGDSLSVFMQDLGMTRCGGAKGDITRLREQMRRLFGCAVYCSHHSANRDTTEGFQLVRKSDMWWHPQNANQAGLWQSTLTLTEEFYQEIITAPVPIDMRVLKGLRRSPLALDLYVWLTYRNSYMKEGTTITWAQLSMQFGAEYGRERDFKDAFLKAMVKVKRFYPDAKVKVVETGISLTPSKPHISKIPKKGKTLSIA